jgi:hypothetical protein
MLRKYDWNACALASVYNLIKLKLGNFNFLNRIF